MNNEKFLHKNPHKLFISKTNIKWIFWWNFKWIFLYKTTFENKPNLNSSKFFFNIFLYSIFQEKLKGTQKNYLENPIMKFHCAQKKLGETGIKKSNGINRNQKNLIKMHISWKSQLNHKNK
jgi:hypothetical protein